MPVRTKRSTGGRAMIAQNDVSTPSGTVHVGSLRGVVLHDAIRRAVADQGTEVELRYGVEDLDPMDAQALLTPDAIERFMGVPLVVQGDVVGLLGVNRRESGEVSETDDYFEISRNFGKSLYAPADFNKDGRPDIAYYGEPKELVVQLNEGTNGWFAPATRSCGSIVSESRLSRRSPLANPMSRGTALTAAP